jgi:hypothetical protein
MSNRNQPKQSRVYVVAGLLVLATALLFGSDQKAYAMPVGDICCEITGCEGGPFNCAQIGDLLCFKGSGLQC